MDCKYPHWYHEDGKDLCDCMPKDMMFEDATCCKSYAMESLKDRILCLLGNDVLFSVDARICRRETFCGTLCFVGCDFIIVNVVIRGCATSLHIPLKMLRFIAPYKGRHLF